MSELSPAAPSADSAVVETTGRGLFQAEARAGAATFLVDEPTSVGGLDTGPNPYDLLAAALGACTVMTMRLYAQRKGWPLTLARANVVHSRPSLQAKDLFQRKITLVGDLDADQRARLLEIANRCPVHMTLTRGSDVETALAPEEPKPVSIESGQHGAAMDEACAD